MLPGQCSFISDGIKCDLPIEFIIEVNTENDDSFMVGLTCQDHKKQLEQKYLSLQKKHIIAEGKITFSKVKTIHTDCVKGNQDDIDDINSRRIKNNKFEDKTNVIK